MAKHSDSPKKEKNESGIEEKVLYINRCSKVVKGGRKFSFSALVIRGNGKGLIGIGFAKANELTDAIRKAGEAAGKQMTEVAIDGTTIPHEIEMQQDGAIVMLKPAKPGTGVTAGSKVRAVIELAGIKDVMAKSLGASTPINQVKAVFKALTQLKSREEIKQMRGVAC